VPARFILSFHDRLTRVSIAARFFRRDNNEQNRIIRLSTISTPCNHCAKLVYIYFLVDSLKLPRIIPCERGTSINRYQMYVERIFNYIRSLRSLGNNRNC